MTFFFSLLLFAGSLLLSEFLSPKPALENARPAGLGDFQFPTATEGRPIPVVFGTVLLKGPNVVWYGDLQQIPITRKVKTGLFSSSRQTTGYRYKLGMQMAVCRGPDDGSESLTFLRVFIGEDEFSNSNDANPLGSGISSGSATFDNPDFFGGQNLGRGGVEGTVSFRPGTRTQSIPSYLSTHQVSNGATPRYSGTAYALLERVELGNSTSIDPWWFEVRRLPDPLGLGGVNAVNGGNDLNPASAIAVLLTNDEWGFGFSVGDIDTASFSAAASTLSTEGNGFSYVLDRKIDANELLRNIERQIDGVVYLDSTTGLWTLSLARSTDSPVLTLTSDNVLEVREFTRGVFEDTSNEVLTQFQHRGRDYADSYGRDQDLGNITQRRGEVVSKLINYTGVKDPDLAQSLASRDILTLSYPLAKAKLVVNREAWALNSTDVIAWTDADLELSGFEMRVSRVDFGTLIDGRITLDLVENVFAAGAPSIGTPDAGNWTPPVSVLSAYDVDTPDQALIFDAPRAFIDRDPESPNIMPRLWFSLRNKGDGAIVYDLEDTSSTLLGTAAGFMLMGELGADLAKTGSTSTSLSIVAGEDTYADISADLETISDSDLGDGLDQIVLIGSEIIGLRTLTVGGSSVTCTLVYRGFLDTVPEAHSAGDPVYMLFAGGALSDGAITLSTSYRLITQGLNGVRLAPGDAFVQSTTIFPRWERPYPVARLRFNSSDFPASVTFDSNLSGIPFDGRGLLLSFNRRDFRLGNEVLKAAGETILPSDFPAANTTEYQVTVTPNSGNASVRSWASASSASIGLARASLIWDFDSLPTSFTVLKEVRHTVDSVVRTGASVSHTMNLTGNLAGRTYLGRMDNNTVESFTAPDTGTYAFSITTDLMNGGVLEAQINGGGYSTVIASNGISGNLAGVTAGDNVEFRHTGVDGDAVFALLLIDPPTSAGYLAPMRI